MPRREVEANRGGGDAEALFVAGLFVLGMLLVGRINGVWIGRLIRRAAACSLPPADDFAASSGRGCWEISALDEP